MGCVFESSCCHASSGTGPQSEVASDPSRHSSASSWVHSETQLRGQGARPQLDPVKVNDGGFWWTSRLLRAWLSISTLSHSILCLPVCFRRYWSYCQLGCARLVLALYKGGMMGLLWVLAADFEEEKLSVLNPMFQSPLHVNFLFLTPSHLASGPLWFVLRLSNVWLLPALPPRHDLQSQMPFARVVLLFQGQSWEAWETSFPSWNVI